LEKKQFPNKIISCQNSMQSFGLEIIVEVYTKAYMPCCKIKCK